MDPMTILTAMKFLRGGGAQKALGLFGDKLGLSGEQVEGLGGLLGGGDESPAATVVAALSLLADHAPEGEDEFEEYAKGVADALRGIAAVRARAR